MSAAGVDGLIIVDLPPEEEDEFRPHAESSGVDIVRLIAPTSTDAQIGTLVKTPLEFVYYVSVRGVTGTSSAAASDVESNVGRIKSLTDLPVAVGFGIRTPEQAAEVAAVADASVVGTAIVEKIANALDENGNAKPQLVSETLDFVSDLAKAVRSARPEQLMNWINNYVRPKIRSLVGVKSDVPENLWVQCPSCEQMLFHRDLGENLNVCRNCGHHMRLPARERLEILFDGGSFTEIELPENVTDPLKFRDRKRYSDRLRDSRSTTGRTDAIIVAHGEIGGHKTVIAVFDFSFMGGSMGIAVGNGIVAGAQLAVLQDAAFVVVPSSGGARMQEGILSLMQMPRTTIAVQQVKEAGLPTSSC